MDYEKKYKEALERAKDFMNGKAHYALKRGENIMCWVFPELCESEDERIRQLLIRFVAYDMSDNYSDDFTSADCIAWLEKQGKQNPVNEDAEKEKYDYVSGQFLYCKGSFNEFKEGESYWLDYIGNDIYVGRSDNILNQKFHITPRQLYTWLDPRHPEDSNKCEQKPAEWSEDDERILNTVIHNLRYPGVNYYKKPIEEEVKWLKSLKDRVLPHPKQEWSKEDEDILNTIINHFKIDIECTENDDIIRWLKSLRPQSQWKPSESDIRILEQVIDGTVNPINYHATLYAILEQLKKLRE